MKHNLTKEEFIILKMLLAKGVDDFVKNNPSPVILTQDEIITNYEERIIWLENCLNNSFDEVEKTTK